MSKMIEKPENSRNMNTETPISLNESRNKSYQSLLADSLDKKLTVRKIAYIGSKLMQKEKIHYHFFMDHSLYSNALYLVFFAMRYPYQYHDKKLLNSLVPYDVALRIVKLFERRIIDRLPVEYLTEEAYYLGHKFYINKNVLVPRSLMSHRFEDFLKKVHWETYRVLDLCTGSGCIGISLALLDSRIKVDCVDISKEALKVAEININQYGLQNRMRCIQSDLFENLGHKEGEHLQDNIDEKENVNNKYDLIISNPPYVAENEYAACPQEIKNEPQIALLGGKDGLVIIDKILTNAKQYLNKEGLLIVEVGYTAAKRLKKYNKYHNITFQWYNCQSNPGKDSFLEIFISWFGWLDSIFVCKAKDLL